MTDQILDNWLKSERIRYLGAFSSIWSGFNDFYRRDLRFSSIGSDREVLTKLQNLPVTDPLVTAFESICDQDNQLTNQSIRVVHDAMTRGFIAFKAQTRFSSLVREVMLNNILRPLVWIAGQTKPQGRGTRQVPIVYVSEAKYIDWYSELRKSEAESQCMAYPSIAVQDALAHRGINSDGCAFFASQVTPTCSKVIVETLEKNLQNDQLFQTLLTFANASWADWVPSSRYAIGLELLYLIRNNVMHGALDPTDVANDALGHAAQEFLYSWLVKFAS